MNILKSIRRLLTPKAPDNAPSNVNSLNTFKCFLKKNNCEYNIINSDSDTTFFEFTYQGAQFFVKTPNKSNMFSLMYPNIINAPADMLDTLRYLCNSGNSISFHETLYYDYCEKQNEYSISIKIGGMFDIDMPQAFSIISTCLNHCFQLANATLVRYQYLTHNGGGDETAINQKEREQYLLREFENSMIEAPFSDIAEKNLTIKTLFEEILSARDINIHQLDISFPDKAETLHYSNIQDIYQIELQQLIIDSSNGVENACLTNGATITVHYKNISDPLNEAHIFLINLLPDFTNEFKLYYRMTVCDSASLPSRQMTQSNPSREPFVNSFLLAFDKKTDKQKNQEFSFMYNDALDKMRENKYNELTPEQRLIIDVKMDDCTYNLYWGYKYFLDNRHIEAIMQLNNVFITNYSSFLQLNRRSQHTFFEVCYILGLCYCKIGLYNLAHYYIEIAATSRDIKHTRAYIDLLINTYDFRAINIIENAIAYYSKEYDLDDDASSDILEGVRAIVHCKVQYYINFAEYSEALSILDQLSKNPDETDFVNKQREIIKRLQNE